ncbi:MAG: amino acid adenylation domain-containing protein [Omnitrophica WOR_2 bacterium]
MNALLAHPAFASTAERYPQKIAVTDGRTALTFGELAGLSDRLARFLGALGVARGDLAAYFMKRSPACLVATMGILKAGAAYIPIDQKTPAERWQRILKDAAPKVLICDTTTLAATMDRIAVLDYSPPVVCLGSRQGFDEQGGRVLFKEDIDAAVDIPLPTQATLDDVAYVLYTSGSTGTPKGVMVTHGNIRNYIDWAVSYFGITAEDRILGTAPFYFDMSTFDIFCSLAAGATLSLATEELLLFPEKLVRFMEQEKISLWKGVSSLLMYMHRAGVVRAGRIPTLRTVIFAGEPLAAQYLAGWMQALPQVAYFNGYGPTEATGVSLCYPVDHVPAPGETIPIGKPCKGARAALIGEDGRPVQPGEIGELCISGDCLARGYLNDPEKTQRRFTPPPPNSDLGERIYWTGDMARQTPAGDYVFVSRKDYQVKWMGYRIELGEIELNLVAHPQVKDAAVLLANTGKDGLTELAAFCEMEGDIKFTDLCRFLGNRVPPYMVPKRFIRVDSLPRNDRGKIAREEILRNYTEKEGRVYAGIL